MKEPSLGGKSENLDILRSLGAPLISAERGDKHVGWDVPTSGDFPGVPRESEVVDIRQATFRALKAYAPDRLLARVEKGFKEDELGCRLYTRPCCPDL